MPRQGVVTYVSPVEFATEISSNRHSFYKGIKTNSEQLTISGSTKWHG